MGLHLTSPRDSSSYGDQPISMFIPVISYSRPASD
jgi:hypothetical protein